MTIVGWKPEESRGALLSKNERLTSELEVAETHKRVLAAELGRANQTIRVLESRVGQDVVKPPPNGWVPIARKSGDDWITVPDSEWTIKAARTAYDTGQVELATRRIGRSGEFELLLFRRRIRANRLPYFIKRHPQDAK